jgi:hypothetical protein
MDKFHISDGIVMSYTHSSDGVPLNYFIGYFDTSLLEGWVDFIGASDLWMSKGVIK